jgi:SAM-dependent methyltransferase
VEAMTTELNAMGQAEDFEFAALREAKNYRAALLKEFGAHLHGRVLEVGAGIGQITDALLRIPEIDLLTSIEPDTVFCTELRARLPQHNLIEGTIADLPSHKAWNAILSVNVLEHIENDKEELAAYCELLRPAQGTLCLFVPARQEIYAPIDRDFGHFRRYSRGDLVRKLRSAGFAQIQIRYYNFVGYFLWWMSFCVLKRRTFDVSSVRLFDRGIFPIIHAFESRVVHPPIGQSLLVTAKG